MLKNIPPLLCPDLLHHLRAMGHGDDIAIVDANFPAHSSCARVVRLDGVDSDAVLEAVLSVLPLDTYVPDAVRVMQIVGTQALPPTMAGYQAIAERAGCGAAVGFGSLERFDFYAAVRRAYAVVATGERRLYGNVLLRKGVIT